MRKDFCEKLCAIMNLDFKKHSDVHESFCASMAGALGRDIVAGFIVGYSFLVGFMIFNGYIIAYRTSLNTNFLFIGIYFESLEIVR